MFRCIFILVSSVCVGGEMEYNVSLEVAGPLAMFARPDTGGTPTSYPAPTWSAAKGIFESIAFLSDGAGWICPTMVEVCRAVGEPGGRVRFQRYTTNYGGPLRESALRSTGIVSGGSGMQFFATVLNNVCYRLHGTVLGPHRSAHNNARHYLQDLFERRLRQGRCFRTPCLGWSEFTCAYWGPLRRTHVPRPDGPPEENKKWKEHCTRWNLVFRDESEVDNSLNLDVPSMLLAVWDKPVTIPGTHRAYAPRFVQSAKNPSGAAVPVISAGVLKFDVRSDWLTETSNKESSHA
jgi:CRISPR-associated protein Cas5d